MQGLGSCGGRRYRAVVDPWQSDDRTALYDVSRIAEMADADLGERRRALLRIERAEFHEHLSSRSFLGTVSHSVNPALDDARWAVEKEMKRRGIWPPRDAE